MIFAFDVDGVIFKMWDGEFHPARVGSTSVGCLKTLEWIRKRGHRVVIFSCRTNPELNGYNRWGYDLVDLVVLLREHLIVQQIPYDSIAVFKPFADWYWDDKANFKDWESVKRQIIDLEESYGYSPKYV